MQNLQPREKRKESRRVAKQMINSIVPPQRVMVAFPAGKGHHRIVERMHAIDEGNDRFVLDNSPFYAYGVSFGDTIAATMQDGELVFTRVVARGGHSTYRIQLPAGCDHDAFLNHWSKFEGMGCSYEGSSANPQRLYAIDVPSGVDVRAVYRLLEKGEADGAWEFEEAHYCDPGEQDRH